VDEPAHVVSAFLYWHGRDVLLPRDMPPLIKIVGGAIPSAAELGFSPHSVQPGQWEWDFANRVIHRDDVAWIGPLFFRARLPLLVFPLATTALLFFWVRALFGPPAALAAAFLFAFDPTSLGHGSLFKNDHAAAFAFLLFAVALWRYAHRPRFPELALLAFSVFLASSAKHSLVCCIPVALLGIAASRSWRALPHAALLTVFLYAASCAASWFDLAPLHPAAFGESAFARQFPLLSEPFKPILTAIPVPRIYWDGLNSLLYWNAEEGNPIYLLGRQVPAGGRLYFLVALLVKTPEAFLILLAAGLCLLLRARPRALWFILPLPALYLAAASLTAMQLGLRLVLPCLPFAAAVASYPFANGARWPRAALAGFALSAMWAFPNGIGYFNHVSGGPANALFYLADSNVDWGQDLPALRRWVDANQPGPVNLYYFGNDNPYRFFNDREIISQAPPWGPDLVSSDRLVPAPGLYAISANLLPGHTFPPRYRDYFASFRERPPMAIAGTSIYIFRVPF
jgi:Dolichyl-phosphate-mannose-protein mannosyltransferase